MNYLTNFDRLLKQLIGLSIIVTACGLFFPITTVWFAPYYGSIAKHIALTNNWSDLILSNQDWLDKPHFPFWITALFFKIFGINSFAYILPGLCFHYLGAYYTYRLAKLLYANSTIALLSCLIYLTVLHLMFSANDVRAEAYLLGQIIPAVYYWILYDRQFSWQNLILGSFFTGLALMTKGIFVIITIISGLLCLWVYTKRLANIISLKWLGALALSLCFALPEIIALYLQFDLHPEKIIFNHTHVSGVRWFFIDSQFGRFFGTGYIFSTNPPPFHQFYFVHTFLWAFLPWTLIYPLAIYNLSRKFKAVSTNEQHALILLLGYFWLSFIMFSTTSFQVDHYTNIIFPFAAILCAKFMYNLVGKSAKIFTFQIYLALLMLVLLAIIIGLVFHGLTLYMFLTIEVLVIAYVIYMFGQIPFAKAIIFPVLAINLTLLTYVTLASKVYANYDCGILTAKITNKQSQIPVVDYHFDSRSLEFYAKNAYYKVDNLATTKQFDQYYLVTQDSEWLKLRKQLPNAQLIAQVKGNSPDKILPNLWNKNKLDANLANYDIILVTNLLDRQN